MTAVVKIEPISSPTLSIQGYVADNRSMLLPLLFNNASRLVQPQDLNVVVVKPLFPNG